jgi:hypothetical protein
MDAPADPLARLADALEALSAGQLKLAEAAERLAAASDTVPRERLAGAAASSRRAARSAAAAAARVSDAPPLPHA